MLLLLCVAILLGVVLITILIAYVIQLHRASQLKNIPCPPLVPLFGNILHISASPEQIWFSLVQLKEKYGKIYQLWLGPTRCYIMCFDPNFAELVMNSSKHIDKIPEVYEEMGSEWIGYGLLISTGEKWHKRRKLLTPAFHFTILEQAAETINSATDILITKLGYYSNGNAFDIAPHLTLCTLDVICGEFLPKRLILRRLGYFTLNNYVVETAMGVKVDAQIETDSEYVLAVRDILNAIFHRIFHPLEHNRFIFKYFTSSGKTFYKSLKILHDMTNNVIRQRRALLLRKLSTAENESLIIGDELGRKQPKAFLDVLLLSAIDGQPLTNSDIREEVDTFMFEGHDTVSSALAFTVYLLATHPLVQEKVFQEQREILGDDKHVQATIFDLNKMKYLELVIKETLRMYPSVFTIGRRLTEDLTFNNVTFRKDTKVVIAIHGIQSDKDYFTDPDQFRPERFLDERTRHPFAFIPFSAGPRNCIGQKFAMSELKLTIGKIVRHYTLTTDHKVQLTFQGILKPSNGVYVQIQPRIYN